MLFFCTQGDVWLKSIDMLKKNNDIEFVDSDYVCYFNRQRSIFSYIFSLYDTTVSGIASFQSAAALSITEA